MITLISLLITAAAAQVPSEVPKIKVVQKVEQPKKRKEQRKFINSQQIRIGIIDTGYNPRWVKVPIRLCPGQHYDAFTNTERINGPHPHGSIVASIIAEELEELNVNYCAVIYQAITPKGLTAEGVIESVRRAQKAELNAVNISLSGPIYSFYEKEELTKLARKGTALFIAAGNDRLDLDKACNTLPACYKIPFMYVVGAMTEDMGFIAPYSNYGKKVDIWLSGSYEIRGKHFEGTSFASPRALVSYVYGLARAMADK